jgi:hypothetical protein
VKLSPTPSNGVIESEPHEPLVDPRIRPLLERYVAAAGAELTEIGIGLAELRLPAAERRWFNDRATIRIAFTLDALEGDADAEIAVVGSPLVEQLIAAIRARGSRLSFGQLPPDHEPGTEAAELRIPVTNGTPGAPSVDIAWHRVVRLVARVVIQAGSEVEEHLVESGFFDATTGVAVPPEIARACTSLASSTAAEDESSRARRRGEVRRARPRPLSDLLAIAVTELRGSLDEKVTRLREEAREKLNEELRRIDGYYESMLNDSGARGAALAEGAARRALEAEHARRRAEEERRHAVRAIVHPVQLAECELLVQRARWELVGDRGLQAPLIAERWLNGDGDWTLACPQCGARNPASLSLCKAGHVACDACASMCGACDDVFCSEHGISACHIDGQPTCAEHARTCPSCREPYCTAHEATCAEGDHVACIECVSPCALCGRSICEEHATITAATATHGERRLCSSCVRLCEGGKSEPVGADEVTRCASCEKYVCEQHRATCAVDEKVHCSKHLRRTDASRRLVCETHRAQCAAEPNGIFASDEVETCSACERHVCARHSHACVEDGRLYCDHDVMLLRGQPPRYVCREHGTICHVDQSAYRIGETTECPVCAKPTCKAHVRNCASCGRTVCVADLRNPSSPHKKCITCSQLRETAEPDDHVIDAVAAALGGGQKPKRWRTARDATHTVVEVHLGWTRRLVLAVRHADNVADTGRRRSVISSKKLRLG